MLRKLFEALVAVGVEETVKRFVPGFLPYVWLLIAIVATLEFLNSRYCASGVKRLASQWVPKYPITTYICIFLIGGTLLSIYWRAIGKAFPESGQVTESDRSHPLGLVTPATAPDPDSHDFKVTEGDTKGNIFAAFEREKIRRVASYNQGEFLMIRFNLRMGELKSDKTQNKEAANLDAQKTNDQYEQWIQDNYKAEADFASVLAHIRVAFPQSQELLQLLEGASRTYRITITEPGPLNSVEEKTSWSKRESERINTEINSVIATPLDRLSKYLNSTFEKSPASGTDGRANSVPSDIDANIKDAGFEVPATISSIQATNLRDKAEEKEAEALAIKLDAKVIPEIEKVMRVFRTVISKSRDAGWVRAGEVQYTIPKRSIYSYTYLQTSAGNVPNFFDIAMIDFGGARWRIWLGYGNTRTTAQRFNTSENGKLMYPTIFIDELRDNQQKRPLGYISFDYSLVPIVGIYALLPETRGRVQQLTAEGGFTGYALLERYVLELIKDTQTQTGLQADSNAP